MQLLIIILLIASITPQLATAGNSIDQRDPLVQADLTLIEDAGAAIHIAIQKIDQLSGADTIPGVNKTAMIARLESLQTFINLVIAPERKRLEIKTLVPKSIFFNPVNYRDLNNVNK